MKGEGSYAVSGSLLGAVAGGTAGYLLSDERDARLKRIAKAVAGALIGTGVGAGAGAVSDAYSREESSDIENEPIDPEVLATRLRFNDLVEARALRKLRKRRLG